MALVSYDQLSVSSDNKASFLYWTIVGAYVIKGTDTDVQTFVDTAVFDVQSAKLLFRAPGVHKSSDKTTAIESTETARKQSEASFGAAVDVMTQNLAAELVRFEERVAENPTLAEVKWKSDSGGGGAFDRLLILFLLAFAIQHRRRVAT
jgi:rhombotail lipoprotein